MNIKTIKIINNNNINSCNVKLLVQDTIKKYDFIETSSNSADLIIAIGGDGTFISAIKETNFSKSSLYIGIHTGHVGFLQEVKVEQIDSLFKSIRNNQYKIDTLSIEDIKIITNNGKMTLQYLALNEIVIREKNLKTLKLDVLVNNKQSQKFAGDGIIISTPTGSTAYNNSLGGSIIHPNLKVLQMLPIAPFPMTKHYASLRNSVIIPENMTISIIPEIQFENKLNLNIDGDTYEINNINKINITTAKEGIKVLRFNNYDFWGRINSKFLKLED